jgi:uncharacterized protein (DUF983 family)
MQNLLQRLLKKGSKKYSILLWKCPKCQEGDLFSKRNPYRLKTCLSMPDRCPVCNQDFQIEPGFYYGALWASYPVVVLLTLAITSFFYLFLALSLFVFIFVLAFCMLAFQPLLLRLGRAIWINVFVKFETGKLEDTLP